MSSPGDHPLHPTLPYSMRQRTSAGADPAVKKAVDDTTARRDQMRREAWHQAFGERVDDVRMLAKSIKQHTIANLDTYLGQFVDAAEARGTKVYFAPDGAHANAICLDIARQNNLSRCVKSKSMVTEETNLLPELEHAGIETWETDLGEYIVQLDEDAPSHIVTPVIHKDRYSVGRLFERKLKSDYSDDPEVLTKIARQTLRHHYERADLGISGGNFLIAETGSLVICTNEGNADLAVTLPRIHIAFVGIEKLVPQMSHLGVFLKLLARSATAQPITVYTTIVHGPRRPDEHDGPEQVHIILLDNGRSRLLGAEASELLECIRCGACLNACPVFREVGGGHAYGAVYSGPIGAVLTPSLKGGYADLPFASSLCSACYDACPMQINIPHHLVRLRAEQAESRVPLLERTFIRHWFGRLLDEKRYQRGIRWMRRLTRAAESTRAAPRWLTLLPGPARDWATERTLPQPSRQTFREWWQAKHDHGGST